MLSEEQKTRIYILYSFVGKPSETMRSIRLARKEFANILIAVLNIKVIKRSKEEIFIYEDGVYVLGIKIVEQMVEDILQEYATNTEVCEITSTIIRKMAATKTEEPPINLINLNNCIYDTKTRSVIPHSPCYLFFSKIPTNYNTDVKPDSIMTFLIELLDGEAIELLQQWIGFCLYRNYFIKKAIILVGERNTGKTTFLRLLTRFIGVDNVSGTSIQKLSTDKFASVNLYNKLANIYDDLSSRDIEDEGTFKVATGNGYLTGEKKFGDQFNFVNYAKLTFSCNYIPNVKNSSDEAYFSRWLIVKFKNQVDVKKINPFLIDELTTADEMSGLLNFALEGLHQILENKEFKYNLSVSETKEEMMRHGSSVASFCQDCLVQDETSHIIKADMHRYYQEYCYKNKLECFEIKKFGKELQIHFSQITDITTMNIRAWGNVKLNVGTSDNFSADNNVSIN